MPPRTSHRVASRIRNCVPLLDCWTPRRPLSLRPQPGEQQQPEEASHIQLVLAPSLPAATRCANPFSFLMLKLKF
jgi:hypothetical protein